MADERKFNGPVTFNGKLVTPSVSVTGTKSLTANDCGKTVFWTKSGGHHITLPAPAAGLYFKIVIAVGSNSSHKIKVATEGTHYFFGNVTVASTTNNKQATQNVDKSTAGTSAEDYEAIELRSNTSTTGGQAGDVVEIWGVDSTSWLVKADLSTAQAAPASLTTIQAA